MDEQNLNILERIHASYYQFTAAERKVADYILAQHAHVQFMSITQLAEECGTAEATISRFCRNLKLKGFNAFKLELARTGAPAVKSHTAAHSSDSLSGHKQEIARLAVEAIQQTLDLSDPAQVSRAVEILERAPHVMCIGTGGSMIMANECAHMFSTVSPKFYGVADSHLQMSAAATMGIDDAIILFSYSGATTSGLQILELAKQRGVKTILVTRYNKSPAAKLADVVLLCGSNEGPFQFGSVPAKVAQLVVIDVLFREYYSRNVRSSEDNVQRIASALSDMHI
jgi:DNA-binding MurR/RpiR family transcriptional regulator